MQERANRLDRRRKVLRRARIDFETTRILRVGADLACDPRRMERVAAGQHQDGVGDALDRQLVDREVGRVRRPDPIAEVHDERDVGLPI